MQRHSTKRIDSIRVSARVRMPGVGRSAPACVRRASALCTGAVEGALQRLLRLIYGKTLDKPKLEHRTIDFWSLPFLPWNISDQEIEPLLLRPS